MANTPNYNLPLFGAADAPDLLTVYNAAMQTLDAKLKEVSGIVYYKQAE